MMNNYTGAVTKAEMKKFDSYDATYQPNTEDYDIKLLVAMETDNGPIWFYTPKANQCISCPPGAGIAVSTVIENAWISRRDAREEKVLGYYPVPKIQVGQTITIRGRYKQQTRHGLQINYVKLLEIANT